jgi:cell division protein FtsZ
MMGTGRAVGDGRAREAAESAIASPLLENVNLAGAKGLLVSITGGMDMTIGEFEEVGNTIKDLASEDANVVVGTTIDHEMKNELRVTIVATGIGQGAPAAKPATGRDRESRIPSLVTNLRSDAEVRPLYPPQREPLSVRRAVGDGLSESRAGDADLDYLDIPAFLRRQAE